MASDSPTHDDEPDFAAHVTSSIGTSAYVLLLLSNFYVQAKYPSFPRSIKGSYAVLTSVVALTCSPAWYRDVFINFGVQIAGAFSVLSMKVIAYSILPLKQQQPSSVLGYIKMAGQEVFAGGSTSADKGETGASDPADKDKEWTTAHQKLYCSSMLKLILEAAFQYLMYDVLLHVVKTSPSDRADGLGFLQSLGFGVVLYLQFCIHYKHGVIMMSFLQPDIIWRAPPAFNKPWLVQTPKDLWARWHQFFKVDFLRLGYRPSKAAARYLSSTVVGRRLPKPVHKFLEDAVPVMGVFILSGLIHEYMCWAAFERAAGYQLAFFAIHGAAVILEAVMGTVLQSRGVSVPSVIQRGVTWPFLCATSVLFMKPWLDAGYHHQFWHPVSVVDLLYQAALKG